MQAKLENLLVDQQSRMLVISFFTNIKVVIESELAEEANTIAEKEAMLQFLLHMGRGDIEIT